MTPLKPALHKFAERINALGLRERIFIFLAAALSLIMALHVFLLDPVLIRQKQASQKFLEIQKKIGTLNLQIQTLSTTGNTDPNAPLRARLTQLQTETENINQDLRGLKNGLITPQQIPMLLKEILRGNHALHLMSLKTLPAQTLSKTPDITATENNTSNPVPDIGAYKHGFEITLEGTYLDILNYLSRIETSPWRVFWGDITLSSDDYPKATLTLKLYTLSLDQSWLTL